MKVVKNLMTLLVLAYTFQACELPLPTEADTNQLKKKKSSTKKPVKKKKQLAKKNTHPEEATTSPFSTRLNESPITERNIVDKVDADQSEYLTANETQLSYAQQSMLKEINAVRKKGCSCSGKYFPPATALKIDQKLVSTASHHAMDMYQKKRLSHSGHYGLAMNVRLKHEGYKYQEASQNITGNSSSAKEALRFMMRNPKNCANIMRPDFTDVGVGNKGHYWSQVFAKPKQTVATFYKPQTVSYSKNSAFRQEMLRAVNQLRAKGCYCGNTYYPPAQPLQWSAKLERASYYHSRDMERQGKLSHRGSNGSKLADRVTQAGYDYRSTGENVSHRKHSIQAAVDSWKRSPGHCVNIMRKEFTEIGAAEYNSFWTQNFGSQ